MSFRRIGALWRKTKASNGEVYFTGTLSDGRNIMIFTNSKKKVTDPDFVIMEPSSTEYEDPSGATKADEARINEMNAEAAKEYARIKAEWARVAANAIRPDAFVRLAVQPPYNLEAVKTAYHKAVLLTHPDRGGSHDAFLKTSEAYKICVTWLQNKK